VTPTAGPLKKRKKICYVVKRVGRRVEASRHDDLFSHGGAYPLRSKLMESREVWVGLDVGVYQTSVCVTDHCGAIVAEGTVRSAAAEICAVFEGQGTVRAIGLETGVGSHLAKQLRKRGLEVVVFDAFRVSRYLLIRRNKTDKNDARGIAEITRLGSSAVTQVHSRGEDCERLRYKLKLRISVIKLRLIGEGTLRTLLHTYGEQIPRMHSADNFKNAVLTIIDRVNISQGYDLSAEVLPLLNLCVSIRKYCRSMDAELYRLSHAHPVCRRLMTIPGVGPVCSLTFVSTIEDPARFSDLASIGPYLGLAPRISETGSRAGRATISKAGDAMTRAALFMSARILMTNGYRPCALADWGVKLKERLGSKRARIALSRKLAIVMASIWKSGGEFVDYPPPSGGRLGLR
jgi:transposase